MTLKYIPSLSEKRNFFKKYENMDKSEKKKNELRYYEFLQETFPVDENQETNFDNSKYWIKKDHTNPNFYLFAKNP